MMNWIKHIFLKIHEHYLEFKISLENKLLERENKRLLREIEKKTDEIDRLKVILIKQELGEK